MSLTLRLELAVQDMSRWQLRKRFRSLAWARTSGMCGGTSLKDLGVESDLIQRIECLETVAFRISG